MRTVPAAVAVATALLCLTPSTLAGEVETDDPIVGTYTVEGTMGGDASYNGGAAIQKVGETYIVVWVFGEDDSQTTTQGVGVMQDGYLAVGYPQGEDGKDVVIVLYKVEGDKLVGKWTAMSKKGQTFTETFTRLQRDEP